ncbi:glycosyltransferase family 87 protein [Saccharopolyspora gloriosae]|uniref:glycosyltransferase family 87 protein n=1 Tax=Saccharopolyspora gloriosae TaxID=455344 RepID=UPI001FB7B5E5|nr:glycosyltransferase family 87 protein [Saccharopolyspora gloriosae]
MILALDAPMVDLRVYQAAGQVVLTGGELYSAPVRPDFFFTYPPFAAVVFAPLGLLRVGPAQAGMVLLNCVLLLFAAWRSWRSIGVRAPWMLVPAVIASAGAAFLIEAVYTNFHDGQINLLLLALVLADMTGPKEGRLRGAGIGIAAGMKLTPLIFVILLVVLGRRRHAAGATAWAAGTALLLFVVLPGPSGRVLVFGRVRQDEPGLPRPDFTPQPVPARNAAQIRRTRTRGHLGVATPRGVGRDRRTRRRRDEDP